MWNSIEIGFHILCIIVTIVVVVSWFQKYSLNQYAISSVNYKKEWTGTKRKNAYTSMYSQNKHCFSSVAAVYRVEEINFDSIFLLRSFLAVVFLHILCCFETEAA